MDSSPAGTPSGTGMAELTEAQRKLVEEHRYLAEVHARWIKTQLPAYVNVNDLEEYGYIGLIQSARRYDSSYGVLFKTFAYQRVRGAILDGVGKMAWFKRSPSRRVKALSAANDLLVEAGDRLALEPTQELPSLIDQATELIGGLITSSMISLSEEESPDVADPEADPARETERVLLSRALQKLIGRLDESERTIVQLRYFEGLTLEDAGLRMGLSKSWASRLHARALKSLQRHAAEVGLESG